MKEVSSVKSVESVESVECRAPRAWREVSSAERSARVISAKIDEMLK